MQQRCALVLIFTRFEPGISPTNRSFTPIFVLCASQNQIDQFLELAEYDWCPPKPRFVGRLLALRWTGIRYLHMRVFESEVAQCPPLPPHFALRRLL